MQALCYLEAPDQDKLADPKINKKILVEGTASTTLDTGGGP